MERFSICSVVFIGTVLGLSYLHTASAITCYDCNSKFDPNCAFDKFSSSTLGTVNCSQIELPHMKGVEAKYCKKTIQFVMNHTRTIRSCGWAEDLKGERPGCYKRTGTKDIMVTFCSCQGDNCNSAPSSGAFSILIVSVTGIFGVLRAANCF